MSKAVIVLAGGLSKRFGENKCLKELVGKPLIVHMLNRVMSVADERVVVVGSETQRDSLSRLAKLQVRVVVDRCKDQGPLMGALTGLENVHAKYALLLPCDTVFVSKEIATLLLDLCLDRSAVIPRWPNSYIEPLQAAYDVTKAIDAARIVLKEGKYDLRAMISHLRRVLYVSTLVLRQCDEELLTFFNINTVEDWKRAESLLMKAE